MHNWVRFTFFFHLGEEPYVAVCQLPDWKPHLRLSDQREYDSAAEELWLKVSPEWQVH